MSRCFPYPPPYYEESLIESIKKERAKAKKEERKKAKKEKEKKKENREKVAQQPLNSVHKEKINAKRKYEERSLLDRKDRYSQNTSNDAIEQLERSGLTEEYEQPCSIQYKHDSPESSQDSNKRRKVMLSISSQNNKHGNVLRVKLPFGKQGDPDPPLLSSSRINSELPLPSVRPKDLEPPTIQPVGQVILPVAKSKQIVCELTAVNEQPCSSGRDADTSFDQVAAAVVPSHRSSSSKRIGGRTWQTEQFGDLIVNWSPLPLQYESSDTGDEWLSGAPTRRSSSCPNKQEGSTESSSCANYMISSHQARACYLPEFDMYQLPYVIPF